MKLVVAMTCSESDVSRINDSVNSLLNGLLSPTDIVITMLDGVKIPQGIRKKLVQPNSIVHLQRADKNYGALSALLGVMERYPIADPEMYIVLLHANCTYPPHLLKEYALTIPELAVSLKQKLPQSTGSVYGIGGVVMTKDKNLNLDREFQQLIGKSDDQYEEKNILGYVRENATVDFLETCSSMCINRTLVKDDFLNYLEKTGLADLSHDIVLSNYFAKHQVLRTQICNLAINRFMLVRSGCFENHKSPSEDDKRDLFEHTIRHLRKLGCFYVYE